MNPTKSKRLTNAERNQFYFNKELKEILIGLFLGDLCAQKRTIKGNTNFHFEQGTVHKDYINHLYSLFSSFCLSEPKLSQRIPDKPHSGEQVKFIVEYCLRRCNFILTLF